MKSFYENWDSTEIGLKFRENSLQSINASLHLLSKLRNNVFPLLIIYADNIWFHQWHGYNL